MAQNPSFLEKLTGAVRVNDGIQGTQNEGEEIFPHKDERGIEKDVMLGVPKKEALHPPKEEEEGQLTIDVYETTGEIVIKSPVAGVNPGDLDVTITNDMVTIKGRRENEEEIAKESYFFQELYWGAFSRSVILPKEIDMEKAKAILKDGILTIRLPKIEQETAKKLSIQVG